MKKIFDGLQNVISKLTFMKEGQLTPKKIGIRYLSRFRSWPMAGNLKSLIFTDKSDGELKTYFILTLLENIEVLFLKKQLI